MTAAAHRPAEVGMEGIGNPTWEYGSSGVQPRRTRLLHQRSREKRRRPGCSFALGILSVGVVLVVQTFWPEIVVNFSGEGGGAGDVGLSQLLVGERDDQDPFAQMPPLPPLPSLPAASLGNSGLSPDTHGAAVLPSLPTAPLGKSLSQTDGAAVLTSNRTSAETGSKTSESPPLKTSESLPSEPTHLPSQSTKPQRFAPNQPIVQYIDTGKQVLRDHGGATVTVHGINFGNEDSDIRVKIGNTWCSHNEWISEETVVARCVLGERAAVPTDPHVAGIQLNLKDGRSPEGLGKQLDVAVKPPPGGFGHDGGYGLTVGVGKGLFSYSRPFIFDVVPLQVGSPLEGPMNITLKAWGIGSWDSSPEASINGRKCSKTVWVDNSSVVCEIPKQVRVALQNPVIKVEGQRSMCGIMAPGVCTVSSQYGSISDPQRIAQTIREIKARGGDWKAVAKTLKGGPTIGSLGQENPHDKPCTNIGNCTAKTLFLSLSSAVMMMMGMGSLCLCIIFAKPIVHWISQDWQRALEESKVGEYDDVLDADERQKEAEELGLVAGRELIDDAAREEELAEEFNFRVRVF